MGVHACSSLSPNKDPEGTGKQRGELGGVSKPQPLLRVTGVSDPTVLPTELPRQACPTLFTLCFFPGATGLSGLTKFILGSTGSAIAAGIARFY